MSQREPTKLGYLFALSRTPHAVLDLATPFLTATLWLGGIPQLRVVLLGLFTAFAAYTAVYALNDLVDIGRDRRRLAAGCPDPEGDLDASLMLHPMAQGCLTYRDAVIWTASWAAAAVTGAYLLHPLCALIFAAACVLEIAYCMLADVTPLRTIIAGVVKSSGPLAAIIAVDPTPAAGRFFIFFAWLALWEIGGQNIPNDWADVPEDRSAGLRTVPVSATPRLVAGITCGALCATVVLSTLLPPEGLLFSLAPGATVQIAYLLGVLSAGAYFLLLPAAKLAGTAWTLTATDTTAPAIGTVTRNEGETLWATSPLRRATLFLFNRASYYPLVLLALVVVCTEFAAAIGL